MADSGIDARPMSLRITTSHGSSCAWVVGTDVVGRTVTSKPDCTSALCRYLALAGAPSRYKTCARGRTYASFESVLLTASGSDATVNWTSIACAPATSNVRSTGIVVTPGGTETVWLASTRPASRTSISPVETRCAPSATARLAVVPAVRRSGMATASTHASPMSRTPSGSTETGMPCAASRVMA